MSLTAAGATFVWSNLTAPVIVMAAAIGSVARPTIESVERREGTKGTEGTSGEHAAPFSWWKVSVGSQDPPC